MKLLAILLTLAAAAAAQTKAHPGFDRMRTLVGEWEGKNSRGGMVRVSYALTSGDSALMETITPERESAMVTMYHLDGDRLMMTHYCGAGNQPRMRAGQAAPDAREIAFTFLDITNLPISGAGHMAGLTVTWQSKDRITQVWTWREKGKPDTQEKFELARKK
jgi:hypothetical protein